MIRTNRSRGSSYRWLVGAGLFAWLGAAPLVAQAPITVILVRHAEKVVDDPSDRDPHLSPAGRERARALVHALREVPVTAIYSTPFHRTRETAQPLAQAKRKVVVVTEASRALADEMRQIIRERHQPHDVVVVVSHSNTVPAIINALGAGPAPTITEDDYDDLFIVTLTGDGAAHLLPLRYGRPTPGTP